MIHIFQSWTQIVIYLTTATSMSRSCTAVIQVDDPEGVSLVYQYEKSATRERDENDAHALWHGDVENLERWVSGRRLLCRARPATFGRICCKRLNDSESYQTPG